MTQHTHNIGDPEGPPLVLYDGVCALCNWAVRFIVARDERRVFVFAPLQSDVGRQWQVRFGIPHDALDTVILVQNSRVHVRSDAAFRILRELKTVWRALLVFRLLPSAIPDLFYILIARSRYGVFGRYDACPIPPPEERHRFLDGAFSADPAPR